MKTISLNGASFSKNFSNRSERSKIITMHMINVMEKKNVPKNLRIIYKSSFFIYNRVITFFTILVFHVEKSPAKI